MPILTIDGRPVTVPPGATILDAARTLGIEIPTLCWYPKLPTVGSCRICLVSDGAEPDTRGGPAAAPAAPRKLMAACATAAQDGMIVHTESPAAVANRKSVLALLLERYPPADLMARVYGNGHSPLPDAQLTEFERYVRRYDVHPKPDGARELPLRGGDSRPGDAMIGHDMSTCVLCTRCVRACDDIQVVGVLDVAERGEHAAIIVGGDGNADHAGCTWCGECVRVCPTGAIHEVLPRERFTVEQIGEAKVVRSVCPYCGVGCQVDLHVRDNTVVRVTSPSMEENTPNIGSTCVKGRFGYDFTQHRDRLTAPLIRKGWVRKADRWVYEGPLGEGRRGGPWRSIAQEGEQPKPDAPPRAVGKKLRDLPVSERLFQDIRDRVATPASWYEPFREATWDEALELVTQELTRIHAARGANAMAVFQSAKCTNEENYLLQRLFRARFGTNNIDHCTRLCHSTSVSAMQAALNTAAASGSMREIEEACNVIFIAGANTTETHPVFGAAIKRAHERGAYLIVADPRRTELAGRADIHLQMQPGSDVALFNAMLQHILAQGLENKTFIRTRTHDFDAVRQAVAPYTPEKAEAITGVAADLIRKAAERYARGPNTSTVWAMGLTQHLAGHDMVTALLNLILATGMIGRWGAAMLPVRGQNNVQGASDMGAIPFVYPDYQPVTDTAIRAKFAQAWGVEAERMSLAPGLKVTEMAREGSPVRALFIMGENPIISDPDIAHAEAWFAGVEFLTVQDLFLTETARYADVVLPGAAFAEKTGSYANTERRVQVATKAIDPPGQARADWEILVELSNRCGLPTRFASPAEIMDEISRVAPAWAGISHQALRGGGLQYPVPHPGHGGTAFLFDERFPTADGVATFNPVTYAPKGELPDDEYPFVMGTGRQLYHWHTGTMSRRSRGLDAREPVPTVEINPADAAALGIRDGAPVRIASRRNAMVIAARISDRVARRQVFVPFHFREAAANLLTSPVLEPHAKMAALKVCAVRIEPAD
ncbi:MAG: formate dehydrogenase subunit alpha [Gemmatimonadetes bacterium GWC2_71_10]|nr:MAG: formate dehydrogenase subunit alpha [Gemmatimonadetes bacterium GWC2_71_10]